MADSDELKAMLKTITAKLEGETTSYGALQYLESFVARKKRSLKPEQLSTCIFHGCAKLIESGNGHNAGHMLNW